MVVIGLAGDSLVIFQVKFYSPIFIAKQITKQA